VDFVTAAFQKFVAVLGPVWDFLKPVIDGVMALMGMKAEPTIAPKLDTSNLGAIADLTSSEGLVPDGTGGAGGSGDSKQVKLLKETQKAILKARTDYESAVKKANDQYASDVQAQINAFRDVFAKATEINIGDLFSAGYRTADSLVTALKQKLSGIKNFAQDAAKLAGLGFSSDFIKQVMAQGPVMGDQLAQALLTATPDTAQQVKDLFTQTQDASQHGVDALASSMQDQFASAAKALTDALTNATNTLNRTLATIQTNLTTSVSNTAGTAVNASVSPTASSATHKVGSSVVVNNHVQTNATADQIAKVTVNSIKFGLPYSLPSSWTSISDPSAGLSKGQLLDMPNIIPASPTH
jgi:Spy/CpxP family protein refolding chaperone